MFTKSPEFSRVQGVCKRDDAERERRRGRKSVSEREGEKERGEKEGDEENRDSSELGQK